MIVVITTIIVKCYVHFYNISYHKYFPKGILD